MEQARPLPDAAAYRAYERIWRRVSPELDPYPEARAAQADAPEDAALLTLPGAQGDPCCMGSSAQAELEVLRGFLREELADARTYRAYARCVSDRDARQTLRALAAAEAEHARQLQAANYLITGAPYRAEVCVTPPRPADYRAMLRAAYHEEVCEGFNYARAAEETTDFCLKKLFAGLSAAEYRHAERLRALLAKTM